MIAYLRAIAYPHDDVSLKRIMNVPTRGIGKKAMQLLEDFAKTQQCSFDEVLQNAAKITGLAPKTRKGMQAFYAMITSLRR